METVPAAAARPPLAASSRRALQALLRAMMRRQARPLADFSRPAVVFAPHPDDETLGCGGTIRLKRNQGAEVWIAFLTDGQLSHAAFVPGETLAALRREEAIRAASLLGVDESHLVFCEFTDGNLASQHDGAVRAAARLLERVKPAEVYFPYRLEGAPDHLAARAAVREALRLVTAGVKRRAFEYPVWYWHHFPWVSLFQADRRQTREAAAQTLRAWFGLRGLKDLRHAADIRTVIGQKKAALEEHATQMRRGEGQPGWPILADVGRGDFLSCFFNDEELFYCYEA